MKGDYAIALIYIGFFTLIGFAVCYTESAWALLALIFTPVYKSKNDE
jgi:hypothetical protein|tara:strand:+ start:4716 stop:4856 length:141 start_codon:yes stop_codon:yes gene_type:complete